VESKGAKWTTFGKIEVASPGAMSAHAGPVDGTARHPVYEALCASSEIKDVVWNFGKFLVNREGQVLAAKDWSNDPETMLADIESALA